MPISYVAMNILCVDDNSEIGNMLSKYFTLMGHTCMFANGGRDALQLIKKNKIDIVLLDLAMPDYSGYDFLADLEKNSALKNRIIAFTALHLANDDVKTLEKFGVTTILQKPIDPDKILSKCELLAA